MIVVDIIYVGKGHLPGALVCNACRGEGLGTGEPPGKELSAAIADFFPSAHLLDSRKRCKVQAALPI
jgi:hypothetical protein